MANFAEYQEQPMTSDNDFTLYPYQEAWNDPNFLPTSFGNPNYLTATSYDNYQAHQAYVQPPQAHFLPMQSYQNVKGHLQQPSPNYSPSNSAAHSFDYQNPPILSSTSDSGASVQSTISSNMGSPSLQPQIPHDWQQQQQQQQSMSMLQPGVVQHDNLGQDMLSTTGFDLDLAGVTGKGCVGESNSVSSQLLQTVSHFDQHAFPFSTPSITPNTPSAFPTWQNTTPSRPPARSGPQSLALYPLQTASPDATSVNDNAFVSPTTPASATSPVLERVKGRRQAIGTAPLKRRATESSPLATSVSYHESELPARPNAPSPAFRSPISYQSNGHFVFPLEFSCSSSSCDLSVSQNVAEHFS